MPTIDQFNACKTLPEFEALYPPRGLPPEAQVVRIAPSPTGMPHIGTMMQATINWALAHKTGGLFILRIEDTDRARLLPGGEQAILDTLSWIGTPPNEGPMGIGGAYGPYVQSERLHLYQIAAKQLVANGHAYHCFCTPERLQALRDEQARLGKTTRYDWKCRDLDPHDVSVRLAAGETSVIRQKVPMKRKVSMTDLVRGRIDFDSGAVDDGVLLKSDGFPTYHLAVVVDDHFMRVTTVVRGEEWIPSSPKHVLIYEGFGWKAPDFLHTVLLRNEQRKKLSKRDGDTSVEWFKAEGYLPAGITNFLTRVMWAHPEEKDIYDLTEFSRLVDPANLPSTGPVADMKLLNFINGHYMGHKGADPATRRSPDAFRALFAEYLRLLLATGRLPDTVGGENGPDIDADTVRALLAEIEADPAYADRVFALEPERNQKLGDVLVNCPYFFETTFRRADRALFEKICPETEKIATILNAVAASYDPAGDHAAWEATMRSLAAEHGVKDKVVFMLTRIAATGQDRTPPLFEILQLIGADRFRARVEGAYN